MMKQAKVNALPAHAFGRLQSAGGEGVYKERYNNPQAFARQLLSWQTRPPPGLENFFRGIWQKRK
jgi:hypothetical protein